MIRRIKHLSRISIATTITRATCYRVNIPRAQYIDAARALLSTPGWRAITSGARLVAQYNAITSTCARSSSRNCGGARDTNSARLHRMSPAALSACCTAFLQHARRYSCRASISRAMAKAAASSWRNINGSNNRKCMWQKRHRREEKRKSTAAAMNKIEEA